MPQKAGCQKFTATERSRRLGKPDAVRWSQIQVRGGPKVTPFLTIHFWTVNASPEGETKR